MSSTIYFTQSHQNKIVAVSAFQAVLQFIGLCKASSSQHKKLVPLRCPSAFSQRYNVPGLSQSVAVWGAKNYPSYGTPDLHLQAHTSQIFVTLDSPARGTPACSAFFFGIAISATCRQALESLGSGFRCKSFGIECRSLSKQCETSNKCDQFI